MSFCPNNRPDRRVLSVGQLLHGPIRYDKNTDKAPKLTGYDTSALDALGDKVMKGAPKGAVPGGNDNAKDPSLLEAMGKGVDDLRTVAKTPLNAAAAYIPGAHAVAKMPGKLYEGAAGMVPDAIKDARLPVIGRVGDAADAIAQTFSPVSLDPNATPADHAEQAAATYLGGKLLGAGAKFLGKHGDKILGGAAAFGGKIADTASGLADHTARMFGREVPSMATAGGPRLGANSLRAAEHAAPHQAHMTAPNIPPQYQGMASTSTPPPIPEPKPGFLKRATTFVGNNPLLSGLAGVGAATAAGVPLAAGGYGARKAATEAAYRNLPDSLKGIADEKRSKKYSDRAKSEREAAYKQGNVKGR